MSEQIRTFGVRAFSTAQPVLHLVRDGSAKTLCRAFTVDQLETSSASDPLCPACLEVLKIDWLLEDATARK